MFLDIALIYIIVKPGSYIEKLKFIGVIIRSKRRLNKSRHS